MLSTLVTALAFCGACAAHGDHSEHSQKPVVDANANWMTKHMAGELQFVASSGTKERHGARFSQSLVRVIG